MSLYKLPFVGKKSQQGAEQDGGTTECQAANNLPILISEMTKQLIH